ncbi:Mitochondrial transcription termination factor, mTERF [Olea europaea subsp. europaea]|uniref:Mitochondrial transcription termination factor, mTERF n=1 Tax=Olea europaea subsp. europaea TaxID=158383 RepID=A0A8S0PCP9_OLEEU|nr:Mitochondrial transcription termination factor, mTERF [Olea europaea subsp. europaea]
MIKNGSSRIEITTTNVNELAVGQRGVLSKISQVSSVLNRVKGLEKSDSLLQFLKESGFSKAQLEKVVKTQPGLLSASIDNTIKPKIKIFQDLGFSSNDIAEIISNVPVILHRSADKRFTPSLSVLTSLLGSSAEMGVCRSSKMFIHAVRVVSSMSDQNLEIKLKLFRDLGFSEYEILEMFRKTPQVFAVSERKLKKVMEVLLATGKYDVSCIFNSPTSFICSVEKKLKPRIQVLSILESRNLIEKWPSLATITRMTDIRFFEKFVNPFLNEVGEVYMANNTITVKRSRKLKDWIKKEP